MANPTLAESILAMTLPEPFMKMRFNAKTLRWDEMGDEAYASDTRVYSQGQINDFRAAIVALVAEQEGQEAIGYVVQHDANGGNFFTGTTSFEGMRRTYGDSAKLVYSAPVYASRAAQEADALPSAYLHPTQPRCVSVDPNAYDGAIPLFKRGEA